MDLLTTYTHNSELQITTRLTLSLIYSTNHYTLSLLQPFIVFPSRCLVTALNSGDSSVSVLAPLPAG
jgi:hypothetical protein